MAQLLAIVAILLYLFSTYRQLSTIYTTASTRRGDVFAMGAAATLLHGISWLMPVLQQGAVVFSLFGVASLIALVISTLIIVSAIKKPLENLFLGIFPMAALLLLLNLLMPSNSQASPQWGLGVSSHIVLSIVAYSVLTIAAFQAVMLLIQNHHLKHKRLSGIMRILPPLQTMDRLLFEMLGVGTLLLSLAIASGFIFLDNIFAQHLLHKTVFTLIAWGILSFLMFAHWRFGWRGNVASKWTLTGTGFLILAYFGSKLALEIILNKA
ncbi:MAG: cytochrome c biogenesis protein CcsA [Bermanella sp.]